MELLGATVVGDEIHAVWERTYQIYDASEGRWRDGPAPLQPRHALSLFNVGGTLYALGGCARATGLGRGREASYCPRSPSVWQ